MSYQYVFYKHMYMYQLIENYMHDAYHKNKIPVSIKEHLGNYKLSDIDYLIIKEYLYTLKSKQYSVEYINSMILILNRLFIYAMDHYVLVENPIDHIRREKQPNNRNKQPVSIQEYIQVIHVIYKSRYKDLFLFILLTGCLEQEAIHLKREDVDLLSHKVKLTYKENTREIIICDYLVNLLTHIFDHSDDDYVFTFNHYPISSKDVSKECMYLRKTYALNRLNTSLLRDLFIFRMLMISDNLIELSHYLGYKRMTQLLKYTRKDLNVL